MTILMLAPGAGMTFAGMPSGSTYVSNAYGVIVITNNSVADQLALIAAGCATLSEVGGGQASTLTGTAYTVQSSDINDFLLFTSNAAVALGLPNNMPVGFLTSAYQIGTGTIKAAAASGGSVVSPTGVTTTTGQYTCLLALVISNSTGTNAEWLVLPQSSLGSGSAVGATTLSSLYSQDGTSYYAQYSIAQVYNDSVSFTGSSSGSVLTAGAPSSGTFAVGQTVSGTGYSQTITSFGTGTGGAGTYNMGASATVGSEAMTASGTGTWLKTGSGNGSGNWTQVSTLTLQELESQITTNSSAITALQSSAASNGLTAARATNLNSELAAGYTDAASRIADDLTNFTAANGHGGWSAFTALPDNTQVDAFACTVGVAATAASIRLRVYSRLASQAASASGPGGATGDVLISDWTTISLTGGLATPQPGGGLMRVVIPLTTPFFNPASSGLLYGYWLQALDSSSDLVAIGTGAAVLPGSSSQSSAGYYLSTVSSGSWNEISTSGTTCPPYEFLTASYQSPAQIMANTNTLAELTGSLTSTTSVLGTQPIGSYSLGIGNNRGGIQVGLDVGPGLAVAANTPVSTLYLWMDGSSGGASVRMRLWQRLTTASNINSPAPTAASGDELVFDWITLSYASAGITAPGSGLIKVGFPLPAGVTTPAAGNTLLIEAQAVDSSGNRVATNIGGTLVSGQPQRANGFYYSATTSTSYSDVTSTVAMSWEMDGPSYSVISTTPGTPLPPPMTYARDQVVVATASISGSVVTVAGTLSRGGAPITFSGTTTLAALTGGVISGGTTNYAGGTLEIAPPTTNGDVRFGALNSVGYLPHANISGLTLLTSPGGSPLVLGTDYNANLEHGALATCTTSQSTQAVSASYTYSPRRNDIVYLNPETLAFGNVTGTARVRDAGEYVPATVPEGMIPLFNIRVVVSPFTPVITPVWPITNGLHRELFQEWQEDADWAQTQLTAFRKLLEANATIPIAVYGDSISSRQSQVPSSTTANGPYRDRYTTANNANNTEGSDFLATIPLYTSTTLFGYDDGAGQVHSKIGWPWELIAQLQARYGATIQFLNFAVAGTTTGNSSGNGTDPAHLAAALSGADWDGSFKPPKFVVICYGANEMGSSTTLANMVTIVNAFQAIGCTVMLLGCPRPNQETIDSGWYSYSNWLLTNRQLRQAARYCRTHYQAAGQLTNATLAGLYAADVSNAYGEYTVASVTADGGNDGTWFKNASGNGSGNWVQLSSINLTGAMGGCFFLNLAMATDTNLTGALGVSLYDWCAADLTHHFGVRDFAQVGNLMSGMVLGGR